MADYNNLKKILQNAVERKNKTKMDDRSKEIVTTIGQDLVSALTPVLSQMAGQSTGNRGEMINEFKSALNEALKEIKVDNKVEVPPIDTSELAMAVADAVRGIKITPQINVSSPEVRMPSIPAPIVNIPDLMKVMGEVSMPGYDYKNPLPVMMMDAGGKPFQFSMGASGGKSDFFTIKAFGQSAFSVPVNSDGEVKVAGTFTASAPSSTYVISGNAEGLPYNYDNPFPVTVTSGASATTAVNIVDSSAVAYSGSNPLPVSLISGTISSTNAYLVDSDDNYRGTIPVEGTVAVSGVTGTIGATILNGEGLARDSWLVSGITNTVDVAGSVLSSIEASVGALEAALGTIATDTMRISDAGGSITVDGTFWQATQPISGTVAVSGVTGTIGANILDSSGIAYSSSNPVPIDDANGSITIDGTVAVSGLTGSIVVIGEIVSDAADTGNAPVKIGGIARTANPTAVAGGDRVSMSMDDLGRQITRPVQVRDLTATAYVSKTTGSTFGTETTLFAGATSTYHDLIYVLASNDSTVAIGMDIRGTTGGNILMHLEIPANGVVGISTPVPLPAGDVGASWTVDLPDVTGTNVYVSALFSKEV